MDRRLIEETFPIKEVSKESSKEKSTRQGHLSTLHLWWARRPLLTSRAVCFASLIPFCVSNAKATVMALVVFLIIFRISGVGIKSSLEFFEFRFIFCFCSF